MTGTPILYSLHNCPYAIRARIALLKASQRVLIRSIKLNNKPDEMLPVSPKGSVPVLIVEKTHGKSSPMIIEESLEVMLWALSKNDPQKLLLEDDNKALPEMINIISGFEESFIPAMNAYSCAKRYHEDNMIELRQVCEVHLRGLEAKLTENEFLYSSRESLLDIALFPFIRKFAQIENSGSDKAHTTNFDPG